MTPPCRFWPRARRSRVHIWVYVRDDRPFGGRAPPAALYYASRDRRHEHPARHLAHFSGILQADAYSGYNGLYDPSRSTGPIIAALCWAHARRQFFELVDIGANARRRKGTAAISPLALEAVKRIDDCSISSVASRAYRPRASAHQATGIKSPGPDVGHIALAKL
jgi:Transposase IS66 family